MKTVNIPNFFIVGAAKAGTTSLYHYLRQHPDIFISPIKEPKFFSVTANRFPHCGPGDIDVDNTIIKNLNDYLSLFANVSTQKCIGEASADYLYFHTHVAPAIKAFNPKAKIIIILRNPIDRAFSAYKHLVRDGRGTLQFEDALKKEEEERKKSNYEFIWFYKDLGFYYSQVKTYIEIFGRERVGIYLFDDLKTKPYKVLSDIFNFLEIENNTDIDFFKPYNTSEIPKLKILHEFLINYDHPLKRYMRPILLRILGKERIESIVNYFKRHNQIKIHPDTKSYLINLYRNDILSLQDLLKIDLSGWLK